MINIFKSKNSTMFFKNTIITMLTIQCFSALGEIDQKEGEPTIGFSEILFTPIESTDSKWIELYNYGNTDIDISLWRIVDFNGNIFEIPSTMEPVPSKGIVLIYFPQNLSDAKDDPSFENDNLSILYCRGSQSKSVLSGKNNGIGLYQSNKQNASNLVDYVCWDRDNNSESTIKNDAVQRGLIQSNVGGVYVGNNALPGDPPSLKAGGSVGRLKYSKTNVYNDWYTYQPFEISPGKKNSRSAPYIDFPYNNNEFDITDGFEPFSIIWYDAAHIQDSARVQISIDRNFSTFVFNEWIESDRFLDRVKVSSVLYPGTFFCKVRFENGDQISHWSEITKFTLSSSEASIPKWSEVKQ